MASFGFWLWVPLGESTFLMLYFLSSFPVLSLALFIVFLFCFDELLVHLLYTFLVFLLSLCCVMCVYGFVLSYFSSIFFYVLHTKCTLQIYLCRI